ncbi:Metalloenzyme, LuxS/M16 peptidase-like protein [Schizophyllum amplum]|uniref:mitochondrial processing peptidase n=1 Tax=Schizophyllum amplum TaxID=97359 RepID=A0A550C8Q1_9AGAR|nr:Metalloenzyme, LuxS/M16 peptidase-like protein [Auriculariopsis ampla]
MLSRTLLGRRLVGAARFTRPSRLYATTTKLPASLTEVTTLSNGLTVATESQSHAQTATVGMWIDAGSRAETEANNGTAHFLEHLAFKGTNRRTQQALELEVENLGAHLNAYTSREQTVYYAKSFRKDVPVARERDVIIREQQEVDKQMEEVVFDHLHSVAFQGQALGRTILGPKNNILSLKRDDLSSYIQKNYTADRMVLVGAGGVDHGELVKLAEKHFSSLPKADFVGSEVRIRDDTMGTANIAIAVEGVGWSSPDYFPMMVMQSILGNWDRSLGAAPLLSSRLSHIVSANNLANSFMSFSTSYSDTGSGAATWCGLLLGLDGTTAVAEDIGRQLVTSGRRMTPEQIENAVNAVTVEEIKRVAHKYIWDQDFAMAAIGNIEGLLDYSRIRADMSSMLY